MLTAVYSWVTEDVKTLSSGPKAGVSHALSPQVDAHLCEDGTSQLSIGIQPFAPTPPGPRDELSLEIEGRCAEGRNAGPP